MNEKKSNIPGWHMMKLDDHAYNLLKNKRDQMKKLGHHASYSDAVREICK
jgi:hypothetical protein